MKMPYGLAGFDSATAMLEMLSRALEGKSYPAMGHSRWLEWPVRATDLLPIPVRRQIYAIATGVEAIPQKSIGKVDMAEIARWSTSLYPQRRYPAVFIGSSSGAMINLAAAIGAPWLPQTLLVALRRKGGGVDDPRGDLEQARESGERFLHANPDVQLHQMHDPSQDRLSLRFITYFRPKFRRLPDAYRQFLKERLEPGGTIVLSRCGKRWPTTRIDERYHFQFGAVGGMQADEYHRGSKRVAELLARSGAGISRWDPPAADDEAPEAEWGFEETLREDVEAFAEEQGLRVVSLEFDSPEELSYPVADFYRPWNRERGVERDVLLIGSFVLNEPYLAMQCGATPYWATFNSSRSHERLKAYLERAEPFDEICMMIFPHGTESVGLPAIEDWKSLLRHASAGRLLGVNERAYPYHFSALARYHPEVRKLPGRYEISHRKTIDDFIRFLADRTSRIDEVILR